MSGLRFRRVAQAIQASASTRSVKGTKRLRRAEDMATASASSSSRLPAAITTVWGWKTWGPMRFSRTIW